MGDFPHIAHQAFFGAAAALGFGVLFNIAPRTLFLCACAGGLALSVRTVGLQAGWSLEAASFAAAFSLGCGVQFLHFRTGIARNTLAVSGCIPMVPGSFAAKTILALLALTAPDPANVSGAIEEATVYGLRVVFTFGAIGAGLAIPTQFLRGRDL